VELRCSKGGRRRHRVASVDLISQACAALSSARHKLVDAEPHVPDEPGLYAVYGTAATWRQLGLGEPPDTRPLYVGKAEKSLKSRDLKQHFETGRTGQSTVRRTFSALLKPCFGFCGVPRNKEKPDKPSHFGLEPDDDLKLTEWMRERLELAVWRRPSTCSDLHFVEVGVLSRWVPPLNIQDNRSSRWRPLITTARRAMAGEARRWMAARVRNRDSKV